MNLSFFIDLLDEGIPFLFLLALGLSFYQGFRRNHILLGEREALLRRYLLFRGDKQARLKTLREDEPAYQELLKTISNGWKTFKRKSDDFFFSFVENTARTRLILRIITIGLLVNSLRVILADYFLGGASSHLAYTIVRELSSYILVIICFALLRTQTKPFLVAGGKIQDTERELFVLQNGQFQREAEHLYEEFDPLDGIAGEEDVKKDQDNFR